MMHIKSMTQAEIGAVLKELGQPAFRAKQIYEWIHARQAASYEEMTNLPAKLRAQLAEEYPLVTAKTVDRQVSAADGTRKFLFDLPRVSLMISFLR